MKKILFAVALCLASPVVAEIPRYNAEGYCQQVAAVSGSSAMIFKGCMDMEQQSYNTLKPIWSRIPAQSKSYCDDVSRVSGGSYSILQGCIEMEAVASNATRTFKY